MKYLLLRAFAACSVALAAVACGGAGETDDHGFGAPEELRADSIAIREILQPSDYAVSGDKLLLVTTESDRLVYVYRLPEGEFLYAGIRVGNGPGELPFYLPTMLNRYERQGRFTLLLFADAYGFTATDTGFVARPVKKLGGAPKVSRGAVPAPDSMMVRTGLDVMGDAVCLYLCDMAAQTVLDTAASRAVRIRSRWENGPWGVQDGGKYLAVHPETGRLEFYDISGGKFDLKKTWGDDTPVSELNNIDFPAREEGKDYYQATTDGKYFYVLERGYQRNDRGRRQTVFSDVLMYNPQGRPVKKYRLDKALDRMMAAGGRLYAFDGNRDFEKLYVYDLPGAGLDGK